MNFPLLLSLISHEVRAPVGVMRGYLRLLEQQGAELSDPQRHAVTAALRAGERATELLNQVSALARLHRGDVTLALAPAPLEPLLRAITHDVAMPTDPIVTVHIEDTPSVAVIAADVEMLRGAITSLTTTVVKAQAVDSRVLIRTRNETRHGNPGVTLTITARDSAETTVDQPLDCSRGGLGLELPIAQFLIDAHRGHVMERREHNQFVGIVVWLPVV